MRIFSLLSYTVFLFFLLLALCNLKTGLKSRISQLSLLTSMSIAIWAFAYSFIYIAPNAKTAYEMHLIGSIGWSLFPALVSHLLLAMSERNTLIESPVRITLFYTIPAVILIKNITSSVSCVAINFVPSISGFGYAYNNAVTNIWTYIYILYVCTYIAFSLFYVYQWQSTSSYALVKKQGKYIIFVIGFILISGIISDLFMPFILPFFPPLSNILVIIFPMTYFFVSDRYQIFRFSEIASSKIILNTIMDPVIITDEAFVILNQNEATCNVLGYEEKSLTNQPIDLFFKDPESMKKIRLSLKNNPYLKSFETTIITASKHHLRINLAASSIHDSQKGFKGFVFAYHDITKRKHRELALYESKEKYRERAEQLHLAANFDNLTELPNRRFFFTKLQETKELSFDSHGDFSIIFMDLNGFKTINDTFGHDIGDQLLILAAQRINDCKHENDFLSRIGGDEFTMILSQKNLEENTKLMIEKIKFSFLDPFSIGEHCFIISLAAGYSICNQCNDEIDFMIKTADQMMYKDKSLIKGTTDPKDIFMYE
ncbi:diguanylate cyclase [Eubacteriaceae bacterium ES2]|nr:diguanylate cyclase [Eubacteriaceae bacterium ES2]